MNNQQPNNYSDNPNDDLAIFKEIDKFIQEKQDLIKEAKDFSKLNIKFENKSDNPDPDYAKAGDSGFDLRANLPNGPIIIPRFSRYLVPTGLFFELPEGFEMQVRPRSGLAMKDGITVLNAPGTVDSGYRGEILIILINLGEKDFIVNHGDRIAQGIIAGVINKLVVNLLKVPEISKDTERGPAGFGSTKLK